MKNLPAILIAASLAVPALAQGPNALNVDVRVPYVNTESDAQNTYQLYGSQPAVELSWAFRLEGIGLLTLIPTEVARGIAIEVRRDDQPIPISIAWAPSLTLVAADGVRAPADATGSITLRPGDRMEWGATIARQ